MVTAYTIKTKDGKVTFMDEHQRQHMIEHERDVLAESKMGKKLRQLRDRLLASGGQFVLLPMIEEDIDALLTRGQTFTGRVKMSKGEPCHCHLNVAHLWEANGGDLKICTGYALNEGIWRQHSWGRWNGQNVETTVKAEAYFGFKMTKAEAKKFFSDNL